MSYRIEVRYNKLLNASAALQAEAKDIVEETSSSIERSIRSSLSDTKLPVNRDVTAQGFRAQIRVGNRRRFYPAFLEFGTRNAAARPFAVPAAEAARPQFMARMKKIMRRL